MATTPMISLRSPARAATTAGLLAGAVGIVVSRIGGADMPLVPPGLVLLVVAAALVAGTRWRWAALFGALVASAEVLGFVLSGAAAGLLALDEPLRFTGAWTRGIGIVVALVAGIVAFRAERTAAR